MRQILSAVAFVFVLSLSALAMSGKLYVDSHRYFDDLIVIGVELETQGWQGFTVRFGYEHPSHWQWRNGPGDPPGIMPVKSIYMVAVEKRIARGWYVSYNHFSAHWHKLAQSYYGHDMPPHGWYGDTYWRLEYRW